MFQLILHSKVINGHKSLQFSIEKMASDDKNSFPSSDPGDVSQIPLSDYAKGPIVYYVPGGGGGFGGGGVQF